MIKFREVIEFGKQAPDVKRCGYKGNSSEKFILNFYHSNNLIDK